MACAITEIFKNGICFRLVQAVCKGLYAAKRSFHSRGIGAKMHFFLKIIENNSTCANTLRSNPQSLF
jgi:hypothetical protein